MSRFRVSWASIRKLEDNIHYERVEELVND